MRGILEMTMSNLFVDHPIQQILVTCRRAEFTEVFQMQADFKATVAVEFNKLIEGVAP